MNLDQLPQKITFKNDGILHEAWVLWLNENGTLQVSENKTIDKMGVCQNWIISPEQVISYL